MVSSLPSIFPESLFVLGLLWYVHSIFVSCYLLLVHSLFLSWTYSSLRETMEIYSF